MAFLDNPQIDKASERCEESVNSTKSLFTRKNGFIVREENPDMGVDLDIELIENAGATRNKFAIQIKSSIEYQKTTKDLKDYLYLDFLTSRLGYLARNTPGLGLIVIYDNQTQILYYDYIEDVISRITEIKKNCDWQNQEKVRIYIPIENKLDSSCLPTIHKKFTLVHKNHYALLYNQASNYNIPFVALTNDENKVNDIPFDEDKLMKMLEEYGSFLFNQLKFSDLYLALSRIANDKISRNPKLSFLAAIVYAEIGKPIESNMFIQYYEINNIEESEVFNDILMFTKYKNDFTLGRIDQINHIAILEQLLIKTKEEQNRLTLKINILSIKLLNSIGEIEIDKSLLTSLKELLIEISHSKLEENVKQLFLIYQTETYHSCALKVISELTLQIQAKELLGVVIEKEERTEHAKKMVETLSLTFKYLQTALEYGKANDNKLIIAHAYHKMSSAFFGIQFDHILHRQEGNTEENPKILEYSFNIGIEAYNLFIELNQFIDAHLALSLVYEIKSLAKNAYQTNIGNVDFSTLLNEIEKLEKFTAKRKFKSTVELYYSDLKKKKDNGEKEFYDLSEKEIVFGATAFLNAKSLPENRLGNIISDIKNRKYFEKHCDTSSYDLLQNNMFGSDIYTHPTDYKIQHKKSGLIIGQGSNVEELLSQLKL